VGWFPIEFLIWGGLFVAMLLLNAVMQRAAQKRLPPQGDAQRPVTNSELPSAAELWRQLGKIADRETPRARALEEAIEAPSGPDTDAVATQTAIPAPVPSRRARATRSKLLGSQRDLRQAIVLMTVLGPCRGTEPPPRRPGVDDTHLG
jgi:hypothetical protein